MKFPGEQNIEILRRQCLRNDENFCKCVINGNYKQKLFTIQQFSLNMTKKLYGHGTTKMRIGLRICAV